MSHAKVIIRERIKSLPKKIKEGLKYEGNIYNMLMENAFDIPLWLKEKKEKERTKVIQKEQKINKKMICKWLKWITLFKLLLHMNKRKNKEVGKKVSGSCCGVFYFHYFCHLIFYYFFWGIQCQSLWPVALIRVPTSLGYPTKSAHIDYRRVTDLPWVPHQHPTLLSLFFYFPINMLPFIFVDQANSNQ